MASSSNSSRPPAQMRPSGSSGNVRGRTAPAAPGLTQARNSGNAGNPPAPALAAGTTVAEARFRKSVEIIQSLPKSGPISTTYEEKLMLYSLYKQATEGPVTTSRPGLLDLLGRAKWDAWKKREKLTRPQAQEAYVETLVAILRGFSDRTQAVELMRELREYGQSAQGLQPQQTRQREADYASTSSSIRSLSPPPETSGSRRSYHSALHTAAVGSDRDDRRGEEDSEGTPRRKDFQRQDEPYRQRYRQSARRIQEETGQQEEYADDDEYTEESGSEGEETGSETVSEDGRPRQRTQQRHTQQASLQQQQSRRTGQQQKLGINESVPQQLRGQASRFAGPSPYQHPAQYPAPVQAQLPPDFPPALPLTGLPSAETAGFGAQLHRRGSAVPSVSTTPPSFANPQLGSHSAFNHATAGLQPISASTSALQPGTGNRAGSQVANLDRALDSIQTSLAALHERLNQLETTRSGGNGARVSGGGFSALRALVGSSPILQFIGALLSRIAVVLRIRSPSGSAARSPLMTLLGRALVSVLASVRDVSNNAVAVLFLAAAVASLRSTRGDWRAVIRAWARILAMASGVGLARENGLLLGLGLGEAGR